MSASIMQLAKTMVLAQTNDAIGGANAMKPAQAMPVAGGQTASLSVSNSVNVSSVIDQLWRHVLGGHRRNASEFFDLCISLARCIDHAVGNNEVLTKAEVIPLLLKQVCQQKSDPILQAVIMVLIVSVKNACKIGWFSPKDKSELLTLADEIGSGFFSAGNEKGCSLPYISKIMGRFYPQMKIHQILASLEIKAGFGTYLIDFIISNNTISSPQDKVHLLVAQTNNIETSSCLISPPLVNFLFNGKAVERRTDVSMDTRPQVPTNLTAMVKNGTNVLQALGQFNGHYIIAIALVSVSLSVGKPILEDYVQPVVATPEADMDLIEEASRISLNCPISLARIKIPVKGHSCKHIQCFDFGNFVEMNLRIPFWRCPHCNRSVCYTDIRIDQNIAKVLREVGENVSDVIISADGSWKAVLDSYSPEDQQPCNLVSCQTERSEHQECASFSKASCVWDLTDGNDEMDSTSTCDIKETKPFVGNTQCHSVHKDQAMRVEFNNLAESSQHATSQAEQNYWRQIFISGSLPTDASSNGTMVGGIIEPSGPSNMMSSMQADAISPAIELEHEDRHVTFYPENASVNNQVPEHDTLHLQQSLCEHLPVSNGYGRSIPRHVSRTAEAFQAPIQISSPGPQHESRTTVDSLASPTEPTVDCINASGTSMQRQQQISRSPPNPIQASVINSPLMQHHTTPENLNRQDGFNASNQSAQVASLPVSGQLFSFQNPHLQQALGQPIKLAVPSQFSRPQNSHMQQTLNRMPYPTSHPQNFARPSTHLPRSQLQQEAVHGGRLDHPTAITSSPITPLMLHSQQAFQQPVQSSHQISRQAPSFPIQRPVQSSRPISMKAPSLPIQRPVQSSHHINRQAPSLPIQRPVQSSHHISRQAPSLPIQRPVQSSHHISRQAPSLPIQRPVQSSHPSIPPTSLPIQQPVQSMSQTFRQVPSFPTQAQTSRMFPPVSENANEFRASVEEQQGSAGGMRQPVVRADGLIDMPSEQDWRPTGRMRGSLSGHAYSAALQEFVIRPGHPAQVVQPLRPQQSHCQSLTAELEAFLQNSGGAPGHPTPSYPTQQSSNGGDLV